MDQAIQVQNLHGLVYADAGEGALIAHLVRDKPKQRGLKPTSGKPQAHDNTSVHSWGLVARPRSCLVALHTPTGMNSSKQPLESTLLSYKRPQHQRPQGTAHVKVIARALRAAERLPTSFTTTPRARGTPKLEQPPRGSRPSPHLRMFGCLVHRKTSQRGRIPVCFPVSSP